MDASVNWMLPLLRSILWLTSHSLPRGRNQPSTPGRRPYAEGNPHGEQRLGDGVGCGDLDARIVACLHIAERDDFLDFAPSLARLALIGGYHFRGTACVFFHPALSSPRRVPPATATVRHRAVTAVSFLPFPLQLADLLAQLALERRLARVVALVQSEPALLAEVSEVLVD